MSNTTVVPHRSICSARSHSNWGNITVAPATICHITSVIQQSQRRPGFDIPWSPPRRFNGLCDTCCELGHLSCDCLLQRDRIYSDVPTLSSPPQNNRSGRGGTGYDLPISPPSYSGRSGGPGYDIPRSSPQYSRSHCYRAKPFVRHYTGGDGTALSPQQQPVPRPFSSFGWDQRYNGGHSTAPQQQPSPRPFSSFDWDQRYNGGHSTTPQQKPGPRSFSSFDWDQRYNGGHSTAPQQQPGPRPFSSFGWEQRYACHNRPPVNAGLTNNIAQGQAQRDVGVGDRAEQQRPSTEVDYRGRPLSEVFGPPESVEHQRATTEMDCHGGPVSKVSGPPEVTASLARGGLPLQARHQRRLQPPSGTLSPPTAAFSDSVFEQWIQSDDMKMLMFSLSEGPQQSAPTAVALAAAAPAVEAVTGTRVFPTVSSKGVAEAPASSAGAASAVVPAAAPETGGDVFPTASVGGAARAPAFADATVALTTAPATGGTVPSATSVGGAPASSAIAAVSEEILAAEPATSGTAPSPASVRGAVGGRESSFGAVSSDAEAEATPSTGGTAAPVASGARVPRKFPSAAGSTGDSWVANICGERGAFTHPFDPGTVFPLEIRYSSDEQAKYNSSRSNDNTSDHNSWWDAACVRALLRPFDPGKRCRWIVRRGKAVLGVDLPFDRGKAWGQIQHGR